MKIKLLDKRMNGYGKFKYGVDFTYNWKGTRFDHARTWCWENYGASVELDIWEDLPENERNPLWAWDRGQYNKSFRCMIYLATDKEANWFRLRWGEQ